MVGILVTIRGTSLLLASLLLAIELSYVFVNFVLNRLQNIEWSDRLELTLESSKFEHFLRVELGFRLECNTMAIDLWQKVISAEYQLIAVAMTKTQTIMALSATVWP